jgi:hypothetical protein
MRRFRDLAYFNELVYKLVYKLVHIWSLDLQRLIQSMPKADFHSEFIRRCRSWSKSSMHLKKPKKILWDTEEARHNHYLLALLESTQSRPNYMADSTRKSHERENISSRLNAWLVPQFIRFKAVVCWDASLTTGNRRSTTWIAQFALHGQILARHRGDCLSWSYTDNVTHSKHSNGDCWSCCGWYGRLREVAGLENALFTDGPVVVMIFAVESDMRIITTIPRFIDHLSYSHISSRMVTSLGIYPRY